MSAYFLYFTKTIIGLTWTCLQRTNRLPFIKETSSLMLSNYLKLNEVFQTWQCAIFFKKDHLRSKTDFVRDCVSTRRYDLNSLSYFAPKVWNMIPLKIKNINSFQKFKTEVRKWAPENCSCYLCRSYIQNLGFVVLI